MSYGRSCKTVESSKNSILIASDGDTTCVMLNGVPISAEAIEFKAEALNGSTVSIKGINLAMPNEYNDFWKYLREKLGYKLSAE